MNTQTPRRFSKTKTDRAGDILISKTSNLREVADALEALSKWRAYHSYPMHVFQQRLKRVAESIDSNAITAQRLKRVPSIIKKLNRKYEKGSETMRLTQMQDIAGCRAVMPNVGQAQELYTNHYINGDLKHIKVNEKDYISNPKEDGYRSIHIVYKYYSDKGKNTYNGLLVEVQIRSRLQHIWATAVETVGFFTGNAIKSNEGDENWESFFRLVSSTFAQKENCPLVPNTPSESKILFREIKKKERELNAIYRMEQWANSLKHFETLKNKKNIYYFLLELDTIQEKLVITPYSRRQEDKALEDYTRIERKIYGKPEYDVVLVGADSLSDLKTAYPNYFLDTRAFIGLLEDILNKD